MQKNRLAFFHRFPWLLITAFSGLLILVLSCKTTHSSELNASQEKPSELFGGKTWTQFQAERQIQVDDYLKRRQVAYDWYVNSPLGVNGVPIALLTFLMGKYPDIWANKLAFPPHFNDYDENGQLKAADQRRVLPLGFGWVKDFDEKDPNLQTNNVFFTCGGCHINRVLVNGKVKHFIGGPSNEVEPQQYAGLIWETGKRLVGEVSLKQTDLNFEEQVDKIFDTVSIGKLYAEMRIHRDIMKAKKFLSRIPKSLGRNQNGTYPSDLDKVDMIHEYDLLVNNFEFFKTVVKNFVGSYIKANTLYKELGTRIPFRAANPNDPDPEGRKQPGVLFGPKPGQMDAFGLVQGIIMLNSVRPDYSWLQFSEARYGNTSEFWLGAQGTGIPLYKDFQRRLAGNAFGLIDKVNLSEADKVKDAAIVRDWFSPNSANSDIKSIWLSGKEVHANWDGNQAANARALASGVSSVGDPRKVDTRVHAAMNPFIEDLPAPAWPFGVDAERAERGEILFKQGKGGEACVSCHYDNNIKIYNVGTDMNRAMVSAPGARRYLKSLAMEACSLGMKRAGEDVDRKVDDMVIKRNWCDTTSTKDEDDIYRRIDTRQMKRTDFDESKNADVTSALGYKADPLYSIWASAPYLHNGSVPSLFALFKATARPAKFYRGNITYNERDVGYEFTQPDANYPAGESKHIAPYDTSLRGNGNAGHDNYTKGWSDDEIYDLIEYLKIL